jgi:hypothetical protein
MNIFAKTFAKSKIVCENASIWAVISGFKREESLAPTRCVRLAQGWQPMTGQLRRPCRKCFSGAFGSLPQL